MANSILNTKIVLRNDTTANWTTINPVLLKGEVGIEFQEDNSTKIKIGDGVTAWNDLQYSSQEDVFNAENVYFDEDLVTTTPIGNITLTNGQATIPTTGKNLKEVWETIFIKEQNPTTTRPSVSTGFTISTDYEVGTTVSVPYNAIFSSGSYTYGPATGVTTTGWTITDSNGKTETLPGGQNVVSKSAFASITVADNTQYSITASATYTDGAIPVTNRGKEYPEGQIKAGSASATTTAKIKGYRNTFYGTLTEKNSLPTSDLVRSLPKKSNKSLTNGAKLTIPVPVGAQTVILAYPATLREVTSITDVNGLNAEIKSSFLYGTLSVEGANGADPIQYRLYKLDYANPNDTANSYNVII